MFMGSFFAILGILLIIPLIIGLAIYIVTAMSLSQMATYEGIPNTWLAWIPIANLYIVGKLIKEIKFSTYVIPSHEYVLPGVALATMLFSKVPLIGFLICIANFVLVVYAFYLLFKRYVGGDKAVLYTVLGFLTCGIMLSIFLYTIKDKRAIA
jgi:hypothetical protein